MLLHLTDNSPEPLRSQIARQLRGKILTGDLAEGSALATPQRVARDHHVSPRDVRQAIGTLVEEGLVALDGDAMFHVAAISAPQRRAIARTRLRDDLREQELSLRELELARDIQRRLLPPARVDGAGFTVVARNFPARFVAGDFYDVLRDPDGSVGVIVADVAGKGFGAALIMASVKAMAPFVAAGRGVCETLRELNRRLCAELGRGQFVALEYARMNPVTGTVELASAGMPDPLLVRADGRVVNFEAVGPRLPLGIRAEASYDSSSCRLEVGDRMLFFSDGIAEARRADGEALGYDALAALVARSGEGGGVLPACAHWLDGILDEAQRATAPALDDDWTAVALERRSSEEAQ